MNIINNQFSYFLAYIMLGGIFYVRWFIFLRRMKRKQKVDKNTIVSLAEKLQKGNMKDEKTLNEVIDTLSKMTGKKVNKDLKREDYKKSNKWWCSTKCW